jgi:hypothetical protein
VLTRRRRFSVLLLPPLLLPHSGLSFVVSHALQCALVAGAVATAVASFRSPPPLLAPLADAVADHGSFAGYWVVLGVLSSIGLGSGLHTFVLFLGPHVVRVANAAVLHGNTGASGRRGGVGRRSRFRAVVRPRSLPWVAFTRTAAS